MSQSWATFLLAVVLYPHFFCLRIHTSLFLKRFKHQSCTFQSFWDLKTFLLRTKHQLIFLYFFAYLVLKVLNLKCLKFSISLIQLRHQKLLIQHKISNPLLSSPCRTTRSSVLAGVPVTSGGFFTSQKKVPLSVN